MTTQELPAAPVTLDTMIAEAEDRYQKQQEEHAAREREERERRRATLLTKLAQLLQVPDAAAVLPNLTMSGTAGGNWIASFQYGARSIGLYLTNINRWAFVVDGCLVDEFFESTFRRDDVLLAVKKAAAGGFDAEIERFRKEQIANGEASEI